MAAAEREIAAIESAVPPGFPLRAVLERFAREIVDVPFGDGGEPGGLWRRSVESARAAAERARGLVFEHGGDPVAAYRARPQWRFAAFVFGLLQHAGEAARWRVSVGAAVWDPLAEPLAAFYAREGRAGRSFARAEGCAAIVWGAIAARVLAPYVPLMERVWARAGAVAAARAAGTRAADPVFAAVLGETRGDGAPAPPVPPRGVFRNVCDAIARAVREGRAFPNRPGGTIYVSERYVWIVVPRALRQLLPPAECSALEACWDQFVEEAIRHGAFSKDGHGVVAIRPDRGMRKPVRAIGIPTARVFTPEEVGRIGTVEVKA
jgi:hypothetical protein